MMIDRYALLWIDLGVLFGLAWLVCLLAKNPLVKQAACRGAIAGSIAISLLVLFGGERQAPVAPVEAQALVQKAAAVAKSTPSVLGIKSDSSSNETASIIAPRATFEPVSVPIGDAGASSFETVLAPIYMAGMCLASALYLLSLLRLRRLHVKSRPVEEVQALEVVSRIKQRLGLTELRVRTIEGDSGVFVAGAFRPTIYAGSDWLDWHSDQDLESFLLHEVAHIVRGDLRWKTFYAILKIVFWPQPLMLLIAKNLDRSAEELCDRHVVAAGVNPAHYANGLLKAAEKVSVPVAGYGLFGSKSGLSRRIETLLHSANSRMVKMTKGARITSAFAVAAAVSGIGYVFAVPLASDDWNDTQPSTRIVTFIDPDGKPIKEGRVTYLVMLKGKSIEKELALIDGSVTVQCQNPSWPSEFICLESPKIGLAFCCFTRESPNKITIKCSKPTTLIGKLVLASGKPAAGVRIRVINASDDRNEQYLSIKHWKSMTNRYSRVSGKDGTYRFDNMPSKGSVHFAIDDSRYAQLELEQCAYTGKEDYYRVQAGPAKPTKPESLEVYQAKLKAHPVGYRPVTHVPPFKLSPAAAIEGRVTRDGKPVQGVHVYNVVEGRTYATVCFAVSDSNGYYRIEQVRGGTVNLMPLLDNKLMKEVVGLSRQSLKVKAGQRLTGIDFELIRGALLKGRIVGSGGDTLLSRGVSIKRSNERGRDFWNIHAICDKSGAFEVRVPPGPIYIDGVKQFSIADGETKTIEVHRPSEVPARPTPRATTKEQGK